MEAKWNEEGPDELPIGDPSHLARFSRGGAQVVYKDRVRAFKQDVGGRGIFEFPADFKEAFVQFKGQGRSAVNHARRPLVGVAGEEDPGMLPGALGERALTLLVGRQGGWVYCFSGDPLAFGLELPKEGVERLLGLKSAWRIFPCRTVDNVRADPGTPGRVPE